MRVLQKIDIRVYFILGAAVLSLFIPLTMVLSKLNASEPTFSVEMPIPKTWSKSYDETDEDFEVTLQYDEVVWNTADPDDFSEFATIIIDEIPNASFEFVADGYINLYHQSLSDREIALMSENEAWSYVTNNLWTSYTKTSFATNKDKLVQLQQSNTETITVKVWYWEDPSDDTNMNKVTREKTFAVNSKLADMFKHIFMDIYDHPDKPVINLADKGAGTWVLRGKNHKSSNTMSAHSLGVAIDINPSTGSFNVNGKWYGNAYGQRKMPKGIWQALPETHAKYHVLYDGSPIVEIFKAYGFYWGGDWKSTPDCMHLSYLGDGSNAREVGIENYNERN